MRPFSLLAICLATAAVLVLPGAASAQEDQPLEASVLLSFGGSVDQNQSGVGNSGYQIGLSLGVAPRTKVGLRYGEIEYDPGEQVSTVLDPAFTYVTVGGEYTFSERYYESGIYFGLGAYRLEGVQGGVPFEESTLGFNLGVTGEFEITRRLGLVLEMGGHVADFGPARYFVTFSGGLAYHF